MRGPRAPTSEAECHKAEGTVDVQHADVAALVDRFGMTPHPEGGWWAQTWLGPVGTTGRPVGTAIVYLLAHGHSAHWHRVDLPEIWHFHAGDPVVLRVDDAEHLLGPDVLGGQDPQLVVPAHAWQSAATTGEWSLVGCTMAPGFWEPGFELADDGWSPP